MKSEVTNPNAPTAQNVLSLDLGTCWTVTRQDAVARCALFASDDGWELRVIVNEEPLLWKRCRRAADAAGVSEDWKARLIDDGWIAGTHTPMPVRRNRGGHEVRPE